MGSAESRRRELANYEVAPRPRKKSSATSPKQNSRGASSSAQTQRRPASGGTKSANAASKQHMKNQTNTKKRSNSIEDNPIARRNSHAYYAQEPRRVRRDAYDAYDRPVRSQPPRRKVNSKKRRRRRRSGFSGVSFLLLLLVLGFVGLGAWRVEEYKAFAEMKAVVSSQTFYAGTTVEGIDVSGMTLEQALDYWNKQVEPAHKDAAVVLNDGTRVTSEQLGYSSNYADVLSGAYNTGRSGSMVERYRRMENAKAQPAAYQVNRIPYSEELVVQYVQNIAQQVDRPAVDAKLKNFNLETYEFEFEPEQNGYALNQQALASDIAAALKAGGGHVSLQVDAVAPAVTQANVASQYGMITSATTNASSSSSNRLSNIKLALKAINGTWLDPGESFSFNQVVGERTATRGYKSATAYSGGKVTEELGGGICQVSTTLFNAVVKADLKIDERHSHSLTVSYVDLGKDAAVDWGNKDLRFTNTSDDRVYICGYVTDDKRVRIGIFGKMLQNGVTISVEGVKTGTSKFKTEYQMSFELGTGQTRQLQAGKDGYSATTYKIWWDSNGNELRRSELCKSNYQSTPEIIEYGP